MRANGKFYKCPICNTEFYRTPGQIKKSKILYCSKECFKKVSSPRMTFLNIDLNPDRMDEKVRKKISQTKTYSSENRKGYKKIKGRHEHRVVAELKLGRKLLPGEVVHHLDENIQNNHPENLMVFKSQKEHAKWHADNNRKREVIS